jgi:lysophospholipase L1-like esterase
MFVKHLKLYQLLVLLCLTMLSLPLQAQSNIWVGTWSCAPYAAGSSNTPPSPYLANNTLRQIVRVSIGGDTLRLKFSNKASSTSLTMNAVNIAVSTGGSTINPSTIVPVTFAGSSSVTIKPYSGVTSDPLAFHLDANSRVAITIYYGQASASADVTSHVGSRTDSYILAGDATQSADFAGSVVTAHWFTINTIDVKTSRSAGCVGVLGNSITDGYGLSGGLQNRWTDLFSQKLLNNANTKDVGVLNLGIGGTNVAGTGATTGAARFAQDILAQSGLRWVIVFYGTNDVGAGASAATVTNAYQKMIDDAHARNLKVYGATITPFGGHSYYTTAHDAVRNEVNTWIRTPGHFDGYIDFDKTIRDPADPTKLLAAYSNDWLHPNANGYKVLGESVDTTLFIERTSMAGTIANAGPDQTAVTNGDETTKTVTLDGSASFDFGDLMASYVWKEGNDTIATGVNPTVALSIGVHTLTLIVKGSNGDIATDQVTITVVKDTGIWLEAEAGTVGSMWDVVTDATASNNTYVTVKSGNTSSGSAPGATGQLSFPFTVPASGTYSLWARVNCGSFDDDSFWMKMDNGAFEMWNGLAVTASWEWKKQKDYTLTEGQHTLTIGYREDGAKLDKLLLTNSTVTPTGMGSTAGNISATETANVKKSTVFPNPVTNNLTLTLAEPEATLSLFTSGGQKVMSQQAHSTTVTLNMKSYPTGIYLLRIAGQGSSEVLRIVKK